MGKKSKLGKRRKDRFYHLAKETGYRARSAFKLIQLNRRYQFLQSSRVLIDLCAAPGGWLQVAGNSMPVSSLIIGVDLVPIKPISNVITFQADITTSECRQQLQRELKTWNADCVLHDGAPNVGASWIQDAFAQAELTLSALKLACGFLREGGWFITKVFRSKEYQPLMWVFQQLFQKVHATKPQASRIESAEIFVVCKGYLAPRKIDPKFLDPRHVFKDVEEEVEGRDKPRVSLTKLLKPPKSAEGYPDNATVLRKATSVADFITGEAHYQLLAYTHCLQFDKPSEVFDKHPDTTDEIRELCADIKVLGARELKQLLKWRDKMRKFLEEAGSDGEEGKVVEEEQDGVGDELTGIDAKIAELEKEEAADAKREKRRLQKVRRRIKERLVQKAEMHKESGEMLRQPELFKLKDIRSKSELDEVEKGEMVAVDDIVPSVPTDEEAEDEEGSAMSDDESELVLEEGEEEEGGEEGEDEEETVDFEGGEEDEDKQSPHADSEKPGNPLVVDLERPSITCSKKAQLWFSAPAFANLHLERDEEIEIQQVLKNFESRGGRLGPKQKAEGGVEGGAKGGSKEEPKVRKVTWEDDRPQPSNGERMDTRTQRKRAADDSESDSEGLDSDSSDDQWDNENQQSRPPPKKVKGDSFEVVPADTKPPTPVAVRKLDPEGLAIGALLVQSKKKREDIIEGAYNRWTHSDDNLPDWFHENESKFCQKQLPVTKEMVQEYREKLKEINARPIKKIAEAKARKKRKALKRMEKARKKAESIVDGVDVTDSEKKQQIKQIYKKAGLLGKKKAEVKYVVAKKGLASKRAKRPPGTKGPYRIVDPRMKKDNRRKKIETKNQGQKKKNKRR